MKGFIFRESFHGEKRQNLGLGDANFHCAISFTALSLSQVKTQVTASTVKNAREVVKNCCVIITLPEVSHIYNMNIYFKVVDVQIQASEKLPKLGRDPSHPGAALKAPHPKD